MRVWHKIGVTLAKIKWEHSIFALPFALTSAMLAASGWPRVYSALISASDAGDHHFANHKRCAGGVVIVMPVDHLGLPLERSSDSIECNQVGVISRHEYFIAGYRRATVRASRSYSADTSGARALIMS